MRGKTRSLVAIILAVILVGVAYVVVTELGAGKEQARLEEIGEAIARVYKGQEIGIEGKGWEREELERIERELKERDNIIIEIEKEPGQDHPKEDATVGDPEIVLAYHEEGGREDLCGEGDVVYWEPSGDTDGLVDAGSVLEIELKDVVFEYGVMELEYDEEQYTLFEIETPRSYQAVKESEDFDFTVREVIPGEEVSIIQLISEGTQKIIEIEVDSVGGYIDVSNIIERLGE